MNTFQLIPEGWNNEDNFLCEEIEEGNILQGIVEKCDEDYNLYVKINEKIQGIIPRKEVEAIHVEEDGLPKENLCTGKVHKYVEFKVKGRQGEKFLLSRKEVQSEALDFIKKDLQEGQTVKGIVKNIKPYGAFVEIGGGVVGLANIEDLSVARIKSPFERLKIGQKVNIVVKCIDRENGKVSLSYKEMFGSWEENAQKFKQGMEAKGIVRETEKNKNGIFVELSPNLVGMIEYQEGLQYGEEIKVLIKKIDFDKQKIKLIAK